jgi:predicted glycosyltransferase
VNDRPVWVDLGNSPHVLFFAPVLAELHRRGVATIVTARDYAQTVPLCERFGIDAEVIGRYGGGGLVGKGRSLAERVRGLRSFAARTRPTVAVSHNAYSQTIAARSLGIPVMTSMDYEYQPANHLAFRCADLVAVPDVFPLDRLRAQGARAGKTWRFPGLKEHISLAGFVADPAYLAAHGIDGGGPLVVVRPPAGTALYHRFENPLFARLLRRLQLDTGLRTIVLPRTLEQTTTLEQEGFGDLLWRGDALDGRQLVADADAIISAGGSMNREAAVLGTPAYSIYAGKLAAVDRALVTDGRLTLLASAADVDALHVVAKPPADVAEVGGDLLRHFVDRLLGLAAR